MSRRYADRVTVRLAPTGCPDDAVRPARFRWRGHWYPVVAVLARWVEADAWWRSAVPAGPGAVRQEAERPDRMLWRVEAGSGVRSGIYDLCALPSSGGGSRWFLVRALD